MRPLRIGVLASGRGTSLCPLITAIKNQAIHATIALIVSDKTDALVLAQQQYGINTLSIEHRGKSREEHEQIITKEFLVHQVDLILLVGYMRILSKTFVDEWRNRILNVHPSLLPSFVGLMDLNVHRAVLAAQKKETGCTVHFVTEEVDGGRIFLQKRCAVAPDDTPEILKARVQTLEGEALLEAVQKIIASEETFFEQGSGTD